MGVLQIWAGKNAGKSFIDGILVTQGNKDALISKNMRENALVEIDATIDEISRQWSGIKDFPERDRIVGILKDARERVQNNDR